MVRVGSPVEVVVKQGTALLQALNVRPEAVRVVRVRVVLVGGANRAGAAGHLIRWLVNYLINSLLTDNKLIKSNAGFCL